MAIIDNQSLQTKNYFSLLLALFPFSFIAGNSVINLNIVLLIFSSILIYQKQIIKIRYYFLDKAIFFLFLLILFSGFYNNIKLIFNAQVPSDYFYIIVKAILFLKYLFFYMILRFLIEKRIINLKFFYITASFSALFVSFDIFYQFFFGQDIFGYEPIGNGRRLSGPFGEELIAGGFIQRFSLFSFFLIPLFFTKNFSYLTKYTIPILFIVFIFGLILSGNRMPFILFFFTICLVVFFQKQTRKYLFSFLIIFSFLFFLAFNLNSAVKTHFKNFYDQIAQMTVLIVEKDFSNKKAPQYMKEFYTFYDTWLLNKYIGGGIKTFRFYCHLRPDVKKYDDFTCNMHPHNYYLEILTETGILGLITISIIFLNLLYFSFYKKYFSISKLNNDNLITPFIFLFITEIFPLKSTGSFFTTGNAAYLFLVMAILIGLIRRDKLFENNS
jgi:O-antigen ligase